MTELNRTAEGRETTIGAAFSTSYNRSADQNLEMGGTLAHTMTWPVAKELRLHLGYRLMIGGYASVAGQDTASTRGLTGFLGPELKMPIFGPLEFRFSPGAKIDLKETMPEKLSISSMRNPVFQPDKPRDEKNIGISPAFVWELLYKFENSPFALSATFSATMPLTLTGFLGAQVFID